MRIPINRIPGNCQNCGKPLVRKQKRFCSNHCKGRIRASLSRRQILDIRRLCRQSIETYGVPQYKAIARELGCTHLQVKHYWKSSLWRTRQYREIRKEKHKQAKIAAAAISLSAVIAEHKADRTSYKPYKDADIVTGKLPQEKRP